jgi:hypothetical protein
MPWLSARPYRCLMSGETTPARAFPLPRQLSFALRARSERFTLHTKDGEIVKVSSPDDHDVTEGNLCIEGRFGYRYVKPRQ